MAQPIYVTPSTTVVEVNPLQSPYATVLLNPVAFPGQIVTILDGTSSIGILTAPIVVSTQSQTFADNSISTVINQPQGFITAQTLATNQWAFLNSFPFRNQYLSAGVQFLNTSTLFTAVTSTTQEYVSSLEVENLTVTGNFLQSEGITLNTNLSSLGTVEFVSSLSVWGNVYLSSYASVIGAVKLFSTLSVGTHLITNSTLRTLSSFYVSASILILGALSTPAIEFQDGLTGPSLTIESRSTSALQIAGATEIGGGISSFGAVNLGGVFQTNTLFASQNASFLSSASLYANASVQRLTSTTQNFSTSGFFSTGSLLSTGLNLNAFGSIYVGGSGYIRDRLTIGSTLQTSTLTVTTLETSGDYANNSTIALISSANVFGGLGAGFVYALSSVFQTANIGSSLTVTGNTHVGRIGFSDEFKVSGDVSTLSQVTTNIFSIERTAYVKGFLSTGTFDVRGGMEISQSTITNAGNLLGLLSPGATTSIQGTLITYGDLQCDGILTISSIVLPSSLTANSFTAQSLGVGSKAIVKNSEISTIQTSSLTVGYIPTSVYPFDLSGSLAPVFLSSLLVSSQQYIVSQSANSRIWVQGGMGIQVEPAGSTLECAPIGYFPSSAVYVFSTLSTASFVVSDRLEGSFIGNAGFLSNFKYPPFLSAFALYVSSAAELPYDGTLITSTILTSSLAAASLFVRSTLRVGSILFNGNAALNSIVVSGINVFQSAPEYNALFVNGVNYIGEGTGTISRRMYINGDVQFFTGNGNYTETLSVWRTLAVSEFGGSDFQNFNSYSAKTIIASTIYGYDGAANSNFTKMFTGIGSITLPSGSISTTSGKFFIGEADVNDDRFNIIQPVQSTLQFNNTMFVNREIQAVGINIENPTFTLDAERISVYGETQVGEGAIQNQINVRPIFSTVCYAFVEESGTYSNILYSSNLTNWSNYTVAGLTTQSFDPTFTNYYTTGISRTTPVTGQVKTFQEFDNIQFFMGSTPAPFGGNQGIIANGPETVFGNSDFFSYSFIGACDTIQSIALLSNLPFDASYFGAYPLYAGGTYSPDRNSLVFLNQLYTFSGNNLWNIVFSVAFVPWGRSNGIYTMAVGGSGKQGPILLVGGAGCNTTLYACQPDPFDPTNLLASDLTFNVPYQEIRSILPIQLSNATSCFLGTGGYISGNDIINGGVTYQSEENITNLWNYTSPIFTGSGLTLATDGKRIVLGGEDSGGNTLYYHNIESSNFSNWTLCSGSRFSQRTNTVLWTGSSWIAAGDSGIRTSQDGITWTNPAPSLTVEVLNIAFASNAPTAIATGASALCNAMYFLDSPDLQCSRFLTEPTISFYSSSVLSLNNACVLDSAKNIIMPGILTNPSPLSGTQFTSTLYANEAFVSTTFTTNQIKVGGYYLAFQTI
jgi:hypothetical protein